MNFCMEHHHRMRVLRFLDACALLTKQPVTKTNLEKEVESASLLAIRLERRVDSLRSRKQ